MQKIKPTQAGFFLPQADTLKGANYIFVTAGSDAAKNAKELKGLYTLAKTLEPNRLPKSETNRMVLICAPGSYTFGVNKFTMDTPFVDVVSLTGGCDVVLDGIVVNALNAFLRGVDTGQNPFTITTVSVGFVSNCKGLDYVSDSAKANANHQHQYSEIIGVPDLGVFLKKATAPMLAGYYSSVEISLKDYSGQTVNVIDNLGTSSNMIITDCLFVGCYIKSMKINYSALTNCDFRYSHFEDFTVDYITMSGSNFLGATGLPNTPEAINAGPTYNVVWADGSLWNCVGGVWSNANQGGGTTNEQQTSSNETTQDEPTTQG